MRFSIVTVTYNNWGGLAHTAESLKSQNGDLFEWIVVDGVSSDGTLDRIDQFEDILDHFVCEPDDGIYEAMNKGLKLAVGQFVVFLNGDDVLIPNVLERIEQAIEQGESDGKDIAMIFGEANLHTPGGGVRHRRVLPPEQCMWHRIPSSHQATFFDRVEHLAVPHDLRFRVSSDYFTIAKIYQRIAERRHYLALPFVVVETPIGGASFSSSNMWHLLSDHLAIQTEVLKVPFFLKWASLLRKFAAVSYLRFTSRIHGA